MTGVVEVPFQIVWTARVLSNKLNASRHHSGVRAQVMRISGSRIFRADETADGKAWMLDMYGEIRGGHGNRQ